MAGGSRESSTVGPVTVMPPDSTETPMHEKQRPAEGPSSFVVPTRHERAPVPRAAPPSLRRTAPPPPTSAGSAPLPSRSPAAPFCPAITYTTSSFSSGPSRVLDKCWWKTYMKK